MKLVRWIPGNKRNHVNGFKKTSTCSLRSNACVKKLFFTNPLISSIDDPELLLRAKFSNGYWGGSPGGSLKGRSG